jgi:hypothetical protein
MDDSPDKRGVYKKPVYYGLIHVMFGIVSVKYYPVGIFFIAYQLLQLIINKRFFLFQLKVSKGNNLYHTMCKLCEFFIGILIGLFIYR